MDHTECENHEAIPPDIADIIKDVESSKAGFYGPDSITWRVNRENALLLSGVSALLLQLGHPMVAAGVADHSTFEQEPIERFRRTFEIVDVIVFGDLNRAIEAAVRVREIHKSVTGDLKEDIGPFQAGDRYDATRTDLLLWVHATLVEQALTAYEIYVDDLSHGEKERYYQESKIFGRLMGIQEKAFPDTLCDFYDYYETMLEDEIVVGSQGADLKRTLFGQFRVLGPLYTFFGSSTLPEPVRDEFGLPWTPSMERLFSKFTTLVRTVLPYLPARIRYNDEYRKQLARLQTTNRATQWIPGLRHR